jgi:hypothetical protein
MIVIRRFLPSELPQYAHATAMRQTSISSSGVIRSRHFTSLLSITLSSSQTLSNNIQSTPQEGVYDNIRLRYNPAGAWTTNQSLVAAPAHRCTPPGTHNTTPPILANHGGAALKYVVIAPSQLRHY